MPKISLLTIEFQKYIFIYSPQDFKSKKNLINFFIGVVQIHSDFKTLSIRYLLDGLSIESQIKIIFCRGTIIKVIAQNDLQQTKLFINNIS